tara:strand:+ start:137 stop:970 length:834 start_codon:yes stop_codon:yes gene_type:complete
LKISENKLRELIRNIITEKRNNKKLNVPIDSRILKQVEYMFENDYSIFVKDKENGFVVVSMFKMDRVRTSKEERKLNPTKLFSKKPIEEVGSVTFFRYDERFRKGTSKTAPQGIKVGGSKRKGVWCVGNSKLKKHDKLGLGPIMYEVGIEYISRHKNCAVGAHFNGASTNHAYNVWEKFDNREDFEKYQFDIDLDYEDFRGNKRKKSHFTKNLSQITPEDDSDDIGFCLNNLFYSSNCNQRPEFAKIWFKSPLTRGFFNNKGRVIKLLHSKDLIFKV